MSAVTIGVDIGGTKALAVALDGAALVRGERRRSTPKDGTSLIDTIVAVIDDLQRDTPEVEGVGIGVPGLVDQRGVLRFVPNLPGVADLAVGELVRERVAGPIVVANDATAAAWAEATLGAAVGVSNFLLATLGTGIGGGLVVDGRLVYGSHGFAGEIGHVMVVPDGVPCPCGQRGCWERYASGSALARLARDAALQGRAHRLVELAGGLPEAIVGEHVTTAAGEGDDDALALIATFAWWLAAGLANLANVFDPDLIVLGGGLIEAGDVLLTPTRRAFAGLIEGAAHRPEIPIVGARLGERAGAIGAALLARPSAGPTRERLGHPVP